MALQTMIKKLNDARDTYEKELKSIGKDARKAVGEFLSPLIPPGYAIRWTQYTPYFNDGEPCEFSVHDPMLVRMATTNADDEDYADSDGDEGMEFSEAIRRYGDEDKTETYQEDDWRTRQKVTKSYVVKGFPKIDGWTKARLKELERAWRELPEDLLEKAFGDHAQCSVTCKGKVTVDEYSHD